MFTFLCRLGAALIRIFTGPSIFAESHDTRPTVIQDLTPTSRTGESGEMQGGGSIGHFRSSVWDPCLIVAQIIAMQALFYTSLGFWILALDSLTHSSKSLDQLFRYQNFYTRDIGGAKLVVAFLLNAVCCAVGLWYLVRRAKLCLDFSCTIHFGHLLLCWTYNQSLPGYLSWWLMQITCITVTTVIGEYLCMQTEIKSIPVGLSSVRTQV